MELNKRDRLLKVLSENGIDELVKLCPRTDKMYSKLYRQLWGADRDKNPITLDVIEYVLEKFPDVSSDYIVRGEGTLERTKIVTPPTHRQDIHLAEGATAAISQTGTASVESPAQEPKPEPDIADMIRTNDLGGLVAIIMQQKDEIIRLKEQRIRDLETSVRIADANLFPPVK